jgi:hypothetical protein
MKDKLLNWYTHTKWWWQVKAPRLAKVLIVTFALDSWLFFGCLLVTLNHLIGVVYFVATFTFYMVLMCLD